MRVPAEIVGLPFDLAALITPMAISFAVFLALFRFVPSVRTRVPHVWVGALAAAVLFELLKHGFAFYLRTLGGFDAVYGSVGAVLAFLLFTYLSATVVLLGAEMAAEYPRVIHGRYDNVALEDRPKRTIRGSLRRLVRSDQARPRAVSDAALAASRRQRMHDEIASRLERRN
jgi:membrane protein